MTSVPRISFIGAGNMASSLVGGLIKHGARATDLVAADPDATQRARLEKARGIATTDDNNAAIRSSRVVVLAVKPQVMETVVRNLKLSRDQLVLSVAAGITLDSLARWGANDLAVVRCMPNTPALYGAGVTALCANARTSAADRELATTVMSAAGVTLWVEREEMLDAVTAVSGSGPAYFFYLMEAMIEAASALGLPDDVARTLTFETARGAAIMAAASTESPAELRRNVTSKGGTTERALGVLDAAAAKAAIVRAVRAAAERSRELAKELDSGGDSSSKKGGAGA
jgi:pyrroline-5-carboxylate reductase